MKKIVLYVLCLVLITFIIPFVFTTKSTNGNTVSENVENENQNIDGQQQINEEIDNNIDEKKETQEFEINTEKYDYKDYKTIKLLHSKTNTIEELELDEYLYGVVSAEMPVDFDIEALKAQATVARTYTLYKIMQNKHGDAHICDDSACCQAWITKQARFERWDEDKRESNWNKIMCAVTQTQGKIITYDGKPINAFFHSNSGGVTESPVNVWGGGSGYPYLQAVQTSGEDGYSQYSSEAEISKNEFVSKMKKGYSDFNINFEESNCIQILEYTEGGRIKTIKIGNHNLSGVEVRTIFGLRSANFEVEITKQQIKFKVKGYGHGVGMSQTGADSLAKQGYKCDDIIKHFYVGVDIINY